MKRTELPTQPCQDLAADLLGPLPTGEYLLVVVDYFSRYFEVAITKSVTSSKLINCLEAMFAILMDYRCQLKLTMVYNLCRTNLSLPQGQ